MAERDYRKSGRLARAPLSLGPSDMEMSRCLANRLFHLQGLTNRARALELSFFKGERMCSRFTGRAERPEGV